MVARGPETEREAHTIRQLARSRHAPLAVVMRARMIVASWQGKRTTAIAAAGDCHPQTVRKWVKRFNAEGVEGLLDRPRAGRNRRLTEADRSAIIALVSTPPPGRLVRQSDGTKCAADETEAAHWTLDALAAAAQAQGIQVKRSQVRRILLAEGVRWRSVRSWATSPDPDFEKKERRS